MYLFNRKTIIYLLFTSFIFAQNSSSIELKLRVQQKVESQSKMIQEMVDMIFSFGELGFQEIETSNYLIGILEKNGFK
ncbi:MAG: amidohydrolase, partial [Candidatus Neomarinimicrobiota bacterium]|nr:amidohydrolase [Candidatus Neomarinimicrobiota bacterium]